MAESLNVVALSDICPAGSSISLNFPISNGYAINGGVFITNGSGVFGDWVSAKVVDINNVTGVGAGAVLDTWIASLYTDWKNCKDIITTPYLGFPPAGTYLQLTYNSVGASPVSVAASIYFNIITPG